MSYAYFLEPANTEELAANTLDRSTTFDAKQKEPEMVALVWLLL